MKGINVHRLSAISDFDYEFSEMEKLGIKYIRLMLSRFISVDMKLDVASIQKMFIAAEKSNIGIVLAVPNKLPWPHHTPLSDNDYMAIWLQLLSMDHISIVALDLINEPHLSDDKGLASRLVKIIRTFSNKPILVSLGSRFKIIKPIPDGNIIYTWHDYQHYQYIHQG